MRCVIMGHPEVYPEVIRKSSGSRSEVHLKCVGSVSVRRRRRPPPPRADRGGSPRWPPAEAAAPRGQALEAALWITSRTCLRLWIACKSLISLITYTNLTENTSHDIHYVKS